MVAVLVPAEMSAPGMGFSFPLPAALADASASGTVRVTMTNGRKLPSWLRYMPHTQTFVVSATPVGALPVEVLVRIGGESWTVLISEQQPR
jgi:hypothetical protein